MSSKLICSSVFSDLEKHSESNNTPPETEKKSLTFLETKEKELSDIFNNKDKNLTNSTEENPFLKKLSSLFSNNKNKNIVDEIEQADDVYPLKNTIKNETYDQKNKPLIDLNKNSTETKNISEQISLLDIDENEKTDNMDDVLEIPAFLRRQAN